MRRRGWRFPVNNHDNSDDQTITPEELNARFQAYEHALDDENWPALPKRADALVNAMDPAQVSQAARSVSDDLPYSQVARGVVSEAVRSASERVAPLPRQIPRHSEDGSVSDLSAAEGHPWDIDLERGEVQEKLIKLMNNDFKISNLKSASLKTNFDDKI